MSKPSGQIIATSAEVTLNGSLVRESPQNPLNSGLGIVVICPETIPEKGFTSKTFFVTRYLVVDQSGHIVSWTSASLDTTCEEAPWIFLLGTIGCFQKTVVPQNGW